jgi:uncharacterized protein (DUF2147 family)
MIINLEDTGMKLWKALSIFIFMTLMIPFANAMSPAGRWTTIDDVTGKKRAVVNITISNGVLNGTIVSFYPQPGDNGICDNCPGNFKGKPVKGLRFIWGLKDDGNGQWSGGNILDPKTGKVYRAKITQEGNSKLQVRGYVGISVLGRTQTWVR